MLGAITGDTIGSVYEFRNTKDYNFELFQYNSTYTDDSNDDGHGLLAAEGQAA